jgi:hypothetical protein
MPIAQWLTSIRYLTRNITEITIIMDERDLAQAHLPGFSSVTELIGDA